MFINGINISTFGGKVQSKAPSHRGKRKNIEMLNGKVIASYEEPSLAPLPIKILFEAPTRDMVHENISNFLTYTSECLIKFKNLSHNYKCYYDSHDIEESGFDEWLFLNIMFNYYELGEELTHEFTGSGTVINQGNLESPIVLEITTPVDIIDLAISGLSEDSIILKNLKKDKTMVVNSLDGTVLTEGKNTYEDTEFWEYPKLLTGSNRVSCNRDNVKIKIRYNPIWN